MSRNKERIDQRNNDMFKRYTDLYDVKRRRHDDVVKQLADEFYIDPETVGRVIRSRSKKGK
jgi:hypothetical protein